MSSHTTLLLRMYEASLTAPPAFAFCQEHVAEGAPLNEADFCGDPPLVLAAGNGHLAVVKFLIDEGADLQQCGLMRDTPLHRAAHNGHLQTVKYLLEEGAELDALDVGDNTALHWASMRGHVEIVKELLEQGGIDTSVFGTGEAKSLNQLFKELKEGTMAVLATWRTMVPFGATRRPLGLAMCSGATGVA